MMSDFTAFIEWLLGAISDFLMAPPMCYCVGLIIVLMVVKILTTLIRAR